MSIDWDREPAAIVGLTKAALEVAAGGGLAVTDHQAGAIVSLVTALVTVAATFFVRSKVTAPATAKATLAEAGVLSAKLATVSTTPFTGTGVSGYGTNTAMLTGAP